MEQGRIDIITMGCSKNLVDSERLMRRLRAKGYRMYHDSDDVCGEVVVVNTCGFIGDAKQESIDMILSLAQGKQEGKIGKLIVMGCLSQRYADELKAEMPEVDSWYGKFDWVGLIDKLPQAAGKHSARPKDWERELTTAPYSAYLKISEGCDRMCAYCAIPLITGRYKSRPVEEILEEVRDLVSKGVSEFNVIAQDLSAYGTDLGFSNTPAPGERSGLATLIDAISRVNGVRWIRLHYAYPVDFPWDVLTVMRERDNVCKYLDIALQHVSTKVLDNMRRHIDRDTTLELIERIRREVPGICLRTTLMTGFPGEGEAEFAELVSFVEQCGFERMGAFAYSEEDDTWAQRHLDDDVPQEVKEQRRDKILDIQERISYEHNQKLIGKEFTVLIETVEDGEILGRTEWDSPEVDCVVHVSYSHENAERPERADNRLRPGEYITVLATDADAFDIFAEFVG